MFESFGANNVTSLSHHTAAAAQTTCIAAVVRSLVCETLELPDADAVFGDEDSLVSAGLSSMGLVALILALESRFDVEVPRREMEAEHFRSVASIAGLMGRLAAPPRRPGPCAEPDRHAAG